MKQTKANKLTLGKKTISKLQLGGVSGGSSYHTFRCPTLNTCTCPPSGSGSGSGSGSDISISRDPYGGAQFLIQPEPYC